MSTGLDVVLLTLLLMVADGPRSPLVVGFFLIPILAGLRFQLRLVWFATIAAMLGYVWLLGWAVWIESARNVRVPRYHELIFLTALAMSGIIQGQVIRRVKSLAAEYARRLAANGATVPGRCRNQPGRRNAMSKAEAEPNPEPTCRDCGATNDPGASECWLCHRRALAESSILQGASQTRFIAFLRRCSEPDAVRNLGGAWPGAIGGLAAAPGLVIVLAVFGVPAWIGALIINDNRRNRGLPTSPAKTIAWIGALTILLPVAGFIAIFLVCLTNGPPNFH